MTYEKMEKILTEVLSKCNNSIRFMEIELTEDEIQQVNEINNFLYSSDAFNQISQEQSKNLEELIEAIKNYIAERELLK